MTESDPWKVGRDHERSATPERRRQRGAFYTPQSVVEGLLRLALPMDSSAPDHLPSSILDPTCGGGAFLVGSLDRLVELGLDPQDALGRVSGIDIDPGAVAATQEALAIWAGAHGVSNARSLADAAGRVVLGDALTFAVPNKDGLPSSIPVPDLIVGNPPFATPLKGTEFPDTAVAFRESHPDLFGPYADLAAIHVQSAIQLCQTKSGAKVAFVLPQSILASRDTEGLRNRMAETAPLRALWATAEAMFEANVRVCAVVLGLADGPADVIIASGPGVRPIATAKPSEPWASLAARALGAPDTMNSSPVTTTWPGTGRNGDCHRRIPRRVLRPSKRLPRTKHRPDTQCCPTQDCPNNHRRIAGPADLVVGCKADPVRQAELGPAHRRPGSARR